MTYTGTFGYAPRTEESLRALVLQRVFSLLGTTTNHLSQPRRCTYFTITRPPSLRPNSLVLVDSSSSPRNVTEATRVGILSKWVRSIQRKSELSQGKTDSVWRYRPWSWWVVVWWEWFSSIQALSLYSSNNQTCIHNAWDMISHEAFNIVSLI